MRHIPIEKLQPGHFLGRNVLNANGTILLREGVQLTPVMINTLINIGVTAIYIKDPNFDDIQPEEVLNEETKYQVISKLFETYNSIKSGKNINSREISASVDLILTDCLKNKSTLIELNEIRSKEADMFLHSMNVCVIATVLGNSMGLNQIQLKELSVGALLHDLGKVVPECNDAQVNSKSHHTWKGFEYLKARQEFGLMIAHCAFQHHEMIDGSGYPRAIAGDQIHLYARIIAVANLYENLIYDIDVSKRMLPHEATEYMMSLAGIKIDRDVLMHFLRCVSIYPTGSSVMLNTKEVGIVVGQHPGLPGRPVLRIISEGDADQAHDVVVRNVDLADPENMTLFITKVI